MRKTFSLLAIVFMFLVACSSGSNGTDDDPGGGETLVIGGIPDQDLSRLEERFNGIAEYLEEETGLDVEYRPSTSYSALVTAFGNGDVQFAWFGGLTGVQARSAAPGADAVLQRPRDTEFKSVFIVGWDVSAQTLEDLKDLSFTFGSESSTSGHLMPRFFLDRAGINPEEDFRGQPSYSGSHDKTWKLVESGSFNAGALNATVWERAVAEGQVDTSKVRVLELTEPYYDYHWLQHPDVDQTHGEGSSMKISDALKSLDMADAEERKLLDLFETDGFIETQNENYAAIEQTARDLDLIR